jgi:hypothetical protein
MLRSSKYPRTVLLKVARQKLCTYAKGARHIFFPQAGLPDFSWHNKPQGERIYQIAIIIPNDLEL